MEKNNFEKMVQLAMQQGGALQLRPVIEKELLHYYIFTALDKEGLLARLVFQGGTSLRLCRGSPRYSEDLDFAGGLAFDARSLTAIKQCVEDHIGSKYGLQVSVSAPQAVDGGAYGRAGVVVSKWQVSIETAPARRDLPRQRIKLEVANVPAHTRELLPLRLNYAFLDGAGEVFVNTETVHEIMADKLIAFAVAKNIRYRDIWDLAWLTRQGARLDMALVQQKIADYQLDNYALSVDKTIENLHENVYGGGFMAQMTRFIDADTLRQSLEREGYLAYLHTTLLQLFSQVRAQL
jgi:Nucleotidyl transferase AbiEii toxin, Type IV TA system